jgi:hypothetical protein
VVAALAEVVLAEAVSVVVVLVAVDLEADFNKKVLRLLRFKVIRG